MGGESKNVDSLKQKLGTLVNFVKQPGFYDFQESVEYCQREPREAKYLPAFSQQASLAFMRGRVGPPSAHMQPLIREGIKKNRFFLGKSPKLWVGGGSRVLNL